ncbi:MAG: hypothetical protein P1U83_11305 [Roseovarius sp.]|nr:hypothetical protein [Roseovarius sp.]
MKVRKAWNLLPIFTMLVLSACKEEAPDAWSDTKSHTHVAAVMDWILEAEPIAGSEVEFADNAVARRAERIHLATILVPAIEVATDHANAELATGGQVNFPVQIEDYVAGTFYVSIAKEDDEYSYLVNATNGPLGRSVYRISFKNDGAGDSAKIEYLGGS